MTDAPFAPFDTLLDRDEALRVLRAATDGADDGELFWNAAGPKRWCTTMAA